MEVAGGVTPVSTPVREYVEELSTWATHWVNQKWEQGRG